MSKISESDSDNVIEIKTVQTSAIKTVFESLKDILIDANLRINPKTADHDEEIKIIEANPSKTLFVHMCLNNSFEKFDCKKSEVVGVNLTNFFRPLKTMSNGDVLTIKINNKKKTYEKVVKDDVTLLIENSDKGKSLYCDIKLMDINIIHFKLDLLKYKSGVTMPSEELQNICKALISFEVDIVNIQNIGKHLTFSGKSDSGEYKYKFTSGDNDIVIEHKGKDTDIIQGFFSLKYLAQFTKCTNLSSTVILFIGNDMPITVQYNVGSMGLLKFVLAPKKPVS